MLIKISFKYRTRSLKGFSKTYNQITSKIESPSPRLHCSRGDFFMDEIKELGASAAGAIHCLTIVGQIEGHQLLPEDTKTTRYEHILPLIAAIEESPEIRGLLILLNTMGGDVEAGLAIAELIAGMRKPSVSLVLGGSHSIGVPLAVAARRSMIAPSAAMTIHPVRVSGVVIGVPQTFNYFARIQERIVRFVTDHSRVQRGTLSDALDYLHGEIAREE